MSLQDMALGGAHYSDNRRDGSAGDKVALSGAEAAVQRQRKRCVGPRVLTLLT